VGPVRRAEGRERRGNQRTGKGGEKIGEENKRRIFERESV
jgi:hypothetical protein